MEYRGYDSVGVATKSDHKIEIRKGVGKVTEVNDSVNLDKLPGSIGIGHTRWATHGKVTKVNAHPHPSNSGKVVIVHNGIIENFNELKEDLQKNGFTFISETDTEVIANLLQQNYDQTSDVKKAIINTVSKLKGHYAFVAMFENGILAAARYHEPMIVGIGKNDYFLSSDVLGFIEYTDDAIYIDNGNLVFIDSSGIQISDFDGRPVKHQVTKVSKEFADAYKGDYAHFTLKEISEQPETILRAGEKTQSAIEQTADFIKHAKTVYITGSGTSYNAALVAKYLMSKYAKIKIEAIISSELSTLPDSIEPNSIFIAVSQSGESADVLEAVNIAKKSNAKILSIANHKNSALVHESSLYLGMNCGPEIGVAATKSFTSQLAIIYKITDKLCDGCLGLDFKQISNSISNVLSNHSKIHVIIINPNDSTYTDTLTSASEIKGRGAKIIGISDKKSDVYDHWIEIPNIKEAMFPMIEIIPIQLLAYYAAVEKDTDPDYPRNLAKSVTVK